MSSLQSDFALASDFEEVCMAFQQSQSGDTGFGIGIILVLALLPTTHGASNAQPVAEHRTAMIPEPRMVLRDSVVTPPSSSITLGPSGRSGTFSVSGGSEDNSVLDIAFSPDGRWLVAGRYRGQLEVWDTRAWTKVLTRQADEDRVTALATSPDGQTVATGGDDKTVKIWRIATGELVAKVRKCKDYADELVFSPDGRLLAVAVNGGPDFVYDLARRSVVKELSTNGFAFSSLGDVLMTSVGRKIAFWDVKTWRVTRELSDPEGHFSKLALDEERQRLIAGAWQGETKIWDLSTGQAVVHLNAGYIASLFVSSDGRWVFTAGDGFIRVWSSQTGQQMCSSAELGLWDLDVSRDGRWIAAGVDNTIQVWSTDDILRSCEHSSTPGQS
jgi:WD40 repeat protein